MNLEKLIQQQSIFDNEVKEKFGLEGTMIPERLLAFTCELYETVNDWQRWKFWKENNEPKDTLLEEYADGLHFVIGCGLEMGMDKQLILLPNDLYQQESDYSLIIHQIHVLTYMISQYAVTQDLPTYMWETVISEYLQLGVMFGFTLDQIEEAYYAKHEVNVQRQENGY